MRESEIQREIAVWLAARGVLFWRCNLGGVRRSGKGFTSNPMRGFPDLAGIMGCGTGRLFTIEVKTKVGRLSPEQERWRAVLEAKGVVYILARSLDDVATRFKAYEEYAS